MPPDPALPISRRFHYAICRSRSPPFRGRSFIVTDDHGAILFRDRFDATREALLAFAQRHLTKLHHLVIEATLNTWAVAAFTRTLRGPSCRFQSVAH